MYWNLRGKVDFLFPWRLIETWDVLKYSKIVKANPFFLGLIETWDVLKSTVDAPQTMQHVRINRNMRCIEIQFPDAAFQAALQINRNMRCIEMRLKKITPDAVQD